MEERIAKYLERTFLFEFGRDVPRDADLFRLGLIDSQGYIGVLKFLETEFAIRFSDEEMLSNVMVTLPSMASSVAAKLQGQPQKA